MSATNSSLEANQTRSDLPGSEEGINVVGLVSLLVFYAAVLAIGIWAGWKQRRDSRRDGTQDTQETTMLAGRKIGIVVGTFTMGATWVDGGFINGSAEETYKNGLIWTHAPFCYALSLIVAGTFFARKMREARYLTMIDPFTQKYGKWGALQALPAAVGEIFWSAAILSALGSTLQVILRIDNTTSVIVSAAISVGYTLIGGMISVSYTDVFQLFFIAFGLFLSLPFALTNEHVSSIDIGTTPWIGSISRQDVGLWIDYALLLLLGGVPWQCYFQRVLSSKTPTRAVLLSYAGCAIALVMAGPAVLFGAIAKATNWNETGYGRIPRAPLPGESGEDDSRLILPLCMQYLTPQWVAFFGLGAISAAVMSSTDSSMLSASTMLSRNVYKSVFRPKATDKEVLIVLSILITFNGCCATALALNYKSIYSLYVLCSDFVYVIVFPQLVLILYFNRSNTYGSVSAFFVSLILRLLCGESTLGIPESISFGTILGDDVDKTGVRLSGPAPFRTIVMLISLLLHILISWTTDKAFTSKRVNLNYDFLHCFETSASGDVVAHSDRYLRENGDNANTITLEHMISEKSKNGKTEFVNDGFG